MKSTFVISLVFLLACASCSSSSNPTSSGTGTLAGKVTLYAPDGTALTDRSGVNVSVQGTSALSQSDSQGNWKIDNLPAGVYNIIFSKYGFDTITYTEHHFLGAGTDFLLSPYLNQESNDSIIFDKIVYSYSYSNRDSVYYRDSAYYRDSVIQGHSVRYWDTIRTENRINVRDSELTNLVKGHLQGNDKPPYTIFQSSSDLAQLDQAPPTQINVQSDGSFSTTFENVRPKSKQIIYIKAWTLSSEINTPKYNEGPSTITQPIGLHITRTQFTIP